MKVASRPSVHSHLGTNFVPLEFLISKSCQFRPPKSFLKVSSCCVTPVNFNRDFRDKGNIEIQLQSEKNENWVLPIGINNSGSVSRCFWDGGELKFVTVEGMRSPWWSFPVSSEEGLRTLVGVCWGAVKTFFLPRVIRSNYLDYVKWKFVHRVSSSALQVLATQAMFRAIGIGYSRSLPSAAALNWVLKDGLGRLSRCIYTAILASSFDINLKRVRFSTSVLFSLSIGIELLTPIFPRYFLFLATIANVAKQISHACYTATSSAVNRSFAVADNLCEVSAKGQIQSVCFDNVGLVLAASLNFLMRNNERFLEALPFVLYPFFAALDLFGIYQELKHVHLRTLTKHRLESIVNVWIDQGYVPSPADVSKTEEIVQLWGKGGQLLPIRMGSMNPKSNLLRLPLLTLKSIKEEDFCFICIECLNASDAVKKDGILLSLREGAATEHIVQGILQACYIRKWLLEAEACRLDALGAEQWLVLMEESKRFAEDELGTLMEKMQEAGWGCGTILLSSEELAGYIHLGGGPG